MNWKLNGKEVHTYNYVPATDKYVFFDENGSVIKTVKGKIVDHDELYRKPTLDLYNKLGRLFGDR